MMKYYLSKNGEVDEFGIQNGWIYKRYAKDHIYYLVALMNAEFNPAFNSRQDLIKDIGIRLVKSDYDDVGLDSPPVEISENTAKKMIAKWKKENKTLWLE